MAFFIEEEATFIGFLRRSWTMALNDTNFNNESLKQAVVNAERSGGESQEPELINDLDIRQDSQQLKAQEHGTIHEEKVDNERDGLGSVTGKNLDFEKAKEAAVNL